jgi:hypothetical protein
VCAQAVQARDDSMEEVLARIDIDAANDSLSEPAKVGGEMEQQIEPAASRSTPRSERSIAIRRRTRRVREGSPARIERA